MNTDTVNIQIMWKEIAIIFVVVFLIRIACDIYLFVGHKQVAKSFFAQDFSRLERKTMTVQKMCRFFSFGARHKKIMLMHNDCCCILASMALLQGNEEQFLIHLSGIMKEENYETKSFMLSLYHLSKGNSDIATKYYEHYLSCYHENPHMQTIMTHLFMPTDAPNESETIRVAASQFKNHAIKQLLNSLGIL